MDLLIFLVQLVITRLVLQGETDKLKANIQCAQGEDLSSSNETKSQSLNHYNLF